MQTDDDVEVVHLNWERVEDPTRDPPPEMVVAEPKPEKPRILPRPSDPNPFQAGNDIANVIVLGLFGLIWYFVMRWAGLIGR